MRDPDVFAAFEAQVVPKLLSERDGQLPIRVWVPGCATGEEVYSIGISLLDAASRLSVAAELDLFGTDLNEKAIASARSATYTEAQLAHLSPERRERFFTRANGRYQVMKQLRERCVFARHNLGADPPLSRMDLISCRNVLIYLGETLQYQILSRFHYALRWGGYLMLGQSEGLGDAAGLFSIVDKRTRLYQKPQGAGAGSSPARTLGVTGAIPPQGVGQQRTGSALSLERMAEQIASSQYGPAWVVVDESYRVMQSKGDTTAFLRMPAGPATFDILQLAREEIRGELRRVLAAVAATAETVRSAFIRLDEVPNGLRIDVRRITGLDEKGDRLLVVFLPGEQSELASGSAEETRVAPNEELQAENQKLRKELQLTAERLQWIINERDTAIHELTCANEEIRSSNEELQSINEEIETSKEEIEAANEELNTLNDELASRNLELSRLSDDLNNVLMSTSIPVLMVDNDLRIRQSTQAAQDLLNVRASDAGRPLREIRMDLSVDDIQPLVRRVINTLTAEEVDVQDRDGCWRVLRVRPYRTSDNRIEGAVLALIDIHQLRQLQFKTEQARRFAESVIESAGTPLAVLDREWRIRLANRAFEGSFDRKGSDVTGKRPIFSARRSLWTAPGLRTALEQVARGGTVLDDFELEERTGTSEPRVLSLSARLVQPDGDVEVLIAVEDITNRKRSEQNLLSERAQLRQAVRTSAKELQSTAQGLKNEAAQRQRTETALHESESALRGNREELRGLTARLLHAQDQERRRVSRELHDDLSQKMAKLQFDIERLQEDTHLHPKASSKGLESLRQQAGALADDVRRIAHQLHPSTLDHLGLAIALRSYCRDFSSREELPVRFTAVNAPKNIPSDIASSLYRIVQEALRNAAKHAGKATVTVTLTGGKEELRLRIRDNGVGFMPSRVRGQGGLGLVSMEERVRLLNGNFEVQSRPQRGVTINISVPLPIGRSTR
jgi:two-component system CheB/CheR fusion protein